MKNYIVLLSAAWLVIASGCAKKSEAESEAPAPVQVAAVTQDTVRRTVMADGTLFPLNQWNVVPKITAPVQKFLVNRGDPVKEGQLLAVLENKDLAATVAANKGQVEQAVANLSATQEAAVPESVVKAQTDVESDQEQFDAAKKVLESRQQLFKDGALARKPVDDAAVQYASAKAQLETAKEHLRTLQTAGKEAQIKGAAAALASARGTLETSQAQLTYSEVRSPGSGVVADRPLYAGDVAQAGTPLLVVMDISRVVARVNVPTADAALVKVGQPATITLPETGRDVEGKVSVVSPATDPNSATVQVWVQAENADRSLKPGTSAHVAIVTETIKNAMLVPAAAILPGETGGTAVLVIDDQHTAHRRAVQLGVRQGDKVQVLTGVMPREDVVVVGGMGVDDKGKVKVVEAAAPETDDDEDQPDNPDKSSQDEPKKDGKTKQQ